MNQVTKISQITIRTALLEQVVKPGGLALGFAGISLGLISYFILPEWLLSAQAFVALAILAVAYFWIANAALRQALAREADARIRLEDIASQSTAFAPKIIQSMQTENDNVILLLEPNRLFGQSMLVTVYYEDERGFELIVGSGSVINAQTNGLIQIGVSAWEEAYLHVKRLIVERDPDVLCRLLVRPAPTSQADLNSLLSHEAALRLLRALEERVQDE